MFTIVAILVIQLVRMLTLYTKYGMRLTGMLFSFRTNEILWKYWTRYNLDLGVRWKASGFQNGSLWVMNECLPVDKIHCSLFNICGIIVCLKTEVWSVMVGNRWIDREVNKNLLVSSTWDHGCHYKTIILRLKWFIVKQSGGLNPSAMQTSLCVSKGIPFTYPQHHYEPLLHL